MTNEQKAVIYRQLLAKAKKKKAKAERTLIEADDLIEFYEKNLDKCIGEQK
jgi:hypothetical protein